MELISNSESPYCQKPSIKILKKRIYGLVCHFPIGILGQVWYLIVSIPDLCNLTYFGRRCWLKNSRCLDSAWKSLMCDLGDFNNF